MSTIRWLAHELNLHDLDKNDIPIIVAKSGFKFRDSEAAFLLGILLTRIFPEMEWCLSPNYSPITHGYGPFSGSTKRKTYLSYSIEDLIFTTGRPGVNSDTKSTDMKLQKELKERVDWFFKTLERDEVVLNKNIYKRLTDEEKRYASVGFRKNFFKDHYGYAYNKLNISTKRVPKEEQEKVQKEIDSIKENKANTLAYALFCPRKKDFPAYYASWAVSGFCSLLWAYHQCFGFARDKKGQKINLKELITGIVQGDSYRLLVCEFAPDPGLKKDHDLYSDLGDIPLIGEIDIRIDLTIKP